MSSRNSTERTSDLIFTTSTCLWIRLLKTTWLDWMTEIQLLVKRSHKRITMMMTMTAMKTWTSPWRWDALTVETLAWPKSWRYALARPFLFGFWPSSCSFSAVAASVCFQPMKDGESTFTDYLACKYLMRPVKRQCRSSHKYIVIEYPDKETIFSTRKSAVGKRSM